MQTRGAWAQQRQPRRYVDSVASLGTQDFLEAEREAWPCLKGTGKHSASERSAKRHIYLVLTQCAQQMVAELRGKRPPSFFQVLPNSSSSASFKDKSLRPCEICARLLRASLAHRTPTPLLEAPVVRGRRAGPRCGAHALGPGPRRPPHRTCAPGPPWAPLGPRSQDGSPSGGITRIHCPASLSTQAPCFTLSVLLFRS